MTNQVDAPAAEALALLADLLSQAAARGIPVAASTEVENGRRVIAVAWVAEALPEARVGVQQLAADNVAIDGTPTVLVLGSKDVPGALDVVRACLAAEPAEGGAR